MAKKIFSGIGKALGIGKKKPAETPAAPAEQKGPIITPLGGSVLTPDPRRRRTGTKRGPFETLLSDKLGA